MVAHTGNSTMTTASSTNLPINNYISPTLKMNLPQNLLHPIDSWTKDDVQKWIEYCIDEYSLGDVNLNDFEMNGKALLLLNEDSFKQRSPRSGDVLHKALQQHRAMLKSLHCQTFPYHLWNNFGFTPSPSSARRYNLPPPPPPPLPMPLSSFHPTSSGVLPHSTAASVAACMHPAFNYMFNRPEAASKPSVINHRANYINSHQQPSTRNREVSASSSSSSSSSSFCPDVTSVKHSRKSDVLHPVNESNPVKREAISPNLTQANRQPTPNTSPGMPTTGSTVVSPSIKQECLDDEDVDVERHETAPTPPITSSSPSSSSPRSSSSVLTKFNQLTNESLPNKIRSQLLSRIKQQPNDVTNTDNNHQDLDGNSLTNDNTRQIRYYHDRIDFRGDILMKPPAAKNCRILWEFLYILLEDPHYESIIHWENREKMIFRIIQADKLAALWGLQKNRLSMTYEKLSRGMRYYYSNNIISKEQSKRLLYRFMRSPDEIRKSMKRNGGTTNMIYSSLNKKSSLSYPTTTSPEEQETNVKYSPDNDDNSSSSSHFTAQPSSQIHQQLLQLFSICSPTATSIPSNLNSTAALLLASCNPATKDSPATHGEKKCETLLANHSKSDRSNSSSPESFDSSRDRTSDSEKQHCSPSQSLSSSTSTSSYSTSTKRKQAVPLSLTARLSYQQHHHDQPLNLAVNKDEESINDSKKQKIQSSPAMV